MFSLEPYKYKIHKLKLWDSLVATVTLCLTAYSNVFFWGTAEEGKQQRFVCLYLGCGYEKPLPILYFILIPVKFPSVLKDC